MSLFHAFVRGYSLGEARRNLKASGDRDRPRSSRRRLSPTHYCAQIAGGRAACCYRHSLSPGSALYIWARRERSRIVKPIRTGHLRGLGTRVPVGVYALSPRVELRSSSEGDLDMSPRISVFIRRLASFGWSPVCRQPAPTSLTPSNCDDLLL